MFNEKLSKGIRKIVNILFVQKYNIKCERIFCITYKSTNIDLFKSVLYQNDKFSIISIK